jgi:hypothetical protein
MVNYIRKWLQIILIKLRVRRIASAALSEAWPKVRIKTAGLPALAACEYVSRHSAAIVHRQVELLVRRHPAIDGSAANVLIVRASERLSRQLLRKLASASRSARRVA